MKLKAFLFNLLAALFVGIGIGQVYGISPVYPAVGIFCAGLVLSKPGTELAFMAVQKELWTDYIIDKLFKNNAFLQRAFNADSFVLQGKVVHIPVAGANPAIQKNRTVLPATISKRTDTEITYSLSEFTSDPTLIPNADKYELSYSKMDSVIGNHVNALTELAGDWMLRDWVAATGGATTNATQLRTLGAAVASHLPSTTGNRLKFTKESLKAARTAMNKNNIPREGRVALLSSDLMDQLLDDTDLKNRDSSLELDMKGGVVTRLYGFDLMERSATLVYDNAGTPVVKDPGAVAAATDNDTAICWHPDSVERALGTVELFEEIGKADYYGDVYSALLRSGGRIRRAEGVVAIIQAPSA